MGENSKIIFIVGIQRSGTTILDNLFTRHKDTAYCENFSSRFYMSPWKFRFIPILLKLQKLKYGKKFQPVSAEGRVWRRYFTEIDYLDESDVSKEIMNYYNLVVKTQLKAFNANNFVNKNPANCLRIRWINKMFPDARYIVIWRDEKAVVTSIYQKMIKEWSVDLNTEYEHGYHGYVTVKEKFGPNVSKMEACINYYNHIKKKFLQDLFIIENRKIEMQYEHFIKNTRDELKKLYRFTGLKWYDELDEIIPKQLQQENNEKWKRLPEFELKLLQKHFPS